MVKALLRGPKTTTQLAELAEITNEHVTQQIWKLRKKLVDFAALTNAGTTGHHEAFYDLREVG